MREFSSGFPSRWKLHEDALTGRPPLKFCAMRSEFSTARAASEKSS
jgi:hypothetical protein